MITPRLLWVLSLAAVLFTLSQPGTDAQGTDAQAPDQDEPGVEVQTRGPIHEAMMQPHGDKVAPSAPVAKEPPPPIPELPPEQKPEGDNIQWIPGYWAWDSERNDFLWVSGVYRNPPEGRRYVPEIGRASCRERV